MRRPVVGLAVLTAALALAAGSGLFLGAAPVPAGEVWAALTGASEDASTTAIVRSLRIPRVVVGALVGAALALSGVLFQALLRNPLAEPYLLGVSSGAALGAVFALTLLGPALGPATTGLFALAGGVLAILLVFRVAASVGRLDTHVLILAGVAVAAFFGAGVMLLLAIAETDALRSSVLWTMGSLERATWEGAWLLGICLAAGGGIAFGLARHLDALALGEEAASYLGARVEPLKRLAYFVASLLAAASVSVAGVIGFVGLVVPHAVRMVWGSHHRTLVPLAVLAGAASLILADSVARTAFRPLELPIGVVTALLGVPLFLVLLRRSYV